MTSELIIKAIQKIKADASVSISGGDINTIVWENEPEQSNYAEQRRNAYPPVGDQLDMLWHTIDKDEKLQGKYFDFYQTLKTVKVKFPKK
jgi:hypothetical protein